MPFKKHTPEEIIGKLRGAEIVLAQGGTTADACRRLSISEQKCRQPSLKVGPCPRPNREISTLTSVSIVLRSTTVLCLTFGLNHLTVFPGE